MFILVILNKRNAPIGKPIAANVNNISISTAALCFTTTVGDAQSNFGKYKFIT